MPSGIPKNGINSGRFKKGHKPFKNFGDKHGKSRGGISKNKTEYSRIYRREHYEHYIKHSREYALIRNYKITSKQYEQILKKQNYLCAICCQNSDKRKLSVDHDHETGKIRGLICRRCNVGLGMFKDSVLFLSEAIKYLNR